MKYLILLLLVGCTLEGKYESCMEDARKVKDTCISKLYQNHCLFKYMSLKYDIVPVSTGGTCERIKKKQKRL